MSLRCILFDNLHSSLKMFIINDNTRKKKIEKIWVISASAVLTLNIPLLVKANSKYILKILVRSISLEVVFFLLTLLINLLTLVTFEY